MKLSGNDIKQLVEAIVSAYPTEDDLDMMIVYGFGVDDALNKITGGNDLKKIVFNLITKWAIPDGKIERLIEEAYQQNKDNPELKDFYQRLNPQPSIYQSVELPSDNSQPITKAEWNQLYFILDKVNDNQLITQTCKETLKSSQNDLLGNCPELQQNIDLQRLKEILLNRFPKRNDNIPTILEFAERLSIKVDRQLTEQLNKWIEEIANNLNIALPTYSKFPVNNDIYKYFLLITIIPKGKNQFELESDLLLYNSSEDSYQPIPKFLNSEERSLIKCDFTEISQMVYDLVTLSEKYNDSSYPITIELLLPCKYLGYPFDIQQIVIDENINAFNDLGCEKPLLVSPYERFSIPNFYKEFERRWKKDIQERLKVKFVNFIEDIKELKNYDYNCSNKLVNQWKLDKIIGLKIIGCWTEAEETQETLFYSIVRSGIPLALWSRCNDLPNCEENLNNLLQSESLQNWHDLYEQVWRYRLEAYQDSQNLGYHLGILSDDPRRIPSHLKPLIETGK
jgi:hypothetical protein